MYVISEEQRNKLIAEAKIARTLAYAPYSNFRVGAALLTKDGNVIRGCNIENVSFTPTVCAERSAIFSAVNQGYKNFEAIAVVTSDVHPTPPCGVCRQVMAEFVGDEFPVIMANLKGSIIEFAYKDLFPLRFIPNTSIGKHDVWQELRQVMVADDMITDEEFQLIQNIMENMENFEQFMASAVEDGNLSASEEYILKNFREKIYQNAYNKANENDEISEDEAGLLEKLADILQNIEISIKKPSDK